MRLCGYGFRQLHIWEIAGLGNITNSVRTNFGGYESVPYKHVGNRNELIIEFSYELFYLNVNRGVLTVLMI